MGDRRPAEGLTDSALEREIERALAVDPSPEFVARVRTRIASEPTPARWWQLQWTMLAPAAALAVVIVMATVWWREAPPEQVASRAGNDVVLSAPSLEPPVSPRVTATTPRAPRVQSRSTRALSGPREPEVLISRDEQRGLELLLAAVRDGRITPALASQLTASATAAEAADIAIPDLVIPPLQQFAALEGEGQ